VSHSGRDSAKYEALWLTRKTTTRGWVYVIDSFAIRSLRFLLHSAPVADFPVEIVAAPVPLRRFGNADVAPAASAKRPFYFEGSTNTAVP